MKDHPQNPVVQRAYVFLPNADMKAAFSAIGQEDLFEEIVEEPFVAITEKLQYGSEVEGWWKTIQTECEKVFVKHLKDLYLEPLSNILGDDSCETQNIHKWWNMVHAEVGEVKNTWTKRCENEG